MVVMEYGGDDDHDGKDNGDDECGDVLHIAGLVGTPAVILLVIVPRNTQEFFSNDQS
jgi:hypothetical protein